MYWNEEMRFARRERRRKCVRWRALAVVVGLAAIRRVEASPYLVERNRGNYFANRLILPTSEEGLSMALDALTNTTRTLLPLVPLIVEAPVIVAHTRLAWPWMRCVLPFAFVSTPGCSSHGKGWRQPLHSVHDPSSVRSRHHTKGKGSSHISRKTLAPVNVGEEREGKTCSRAVDGSNSIWWPFSRQSALVSAATAFSTAWGVAGATSVAIAGSDVSQSAKLSGSSAEISSTKANMRDSYDRFSEGYDQLDGGWAAEVLGVEDLRRNMLSRASGRVLEVGVGTGLNLRHYPQGQGIITHIDAIDLSSGMLQQASARSKALGMQGLMHLKEMDVEMLEFDDQSFDTVVDTFSLCVFNNPVVALGEMARVCKPGGRVLLLENSKSSFGPLAAYQDLTASTIAEGGGKGCFWNQDVVSLVHKAGLRVIRSSPALGGVFLTLECEPELRTQKM